MVYKTEIQLIMKFNKLALLIASCITIGITQISAQCVNWNDLPNKDYLEGQHSVYRGLIKNENFSDAFKPWKEVYTAAPAADGNRDFHYRDGIAIYRSMYDAETDATKKDEYVAIILGLYDEMIACYAAKGIVLKDNSEASYKKMISDLHAAKGYDMYYFFRSPYSETSKVLQEAINIGGENAQYTVITPYADIAVYEFTHETIDKAEARRIHDALVSLAETNESNGNQYAAYYTQAKEAAKAKFRDIEDYIFDCDYFKALWMDEYEKNSEDPLYAKDLYNRLRQKGCEDTDPLLAKLATQYETYAAAENARRQAEYEANTPGILAKKAYDAEDYSGAIAKYREAIDGADNDSDKAGYHFSIASIMFRKLKQYSSARQEALKAVSLRSGWGQPYLLIGDMYATGARDCGDSWNQRLAILAAVDKYGYAASIDPDAAEEGREKVSRYRSSFPLQDEGFMRGVKAGTTETVGCWIGEQVKVRYQ